MVWQGGLLGRHRLLRHEHPSVQLFCANRKHDNAMAFTAHPKDPKASQEEKPWSAVSPSFRCIDYLERLQKSHQQSEHCKCTAEQAIEYRASTNSYPNTKNSPS